MKLRIFVFALFCAVRLAGDDGSLAEARAYFEEYKRLTHSQGGGQEGEREKYMEAAPKLFAALALAPMDENIRYAELDYHTTLLHYLPIRDRLSQGREQLERSKKFRLDFPQSKKSLFGVERIFGEAPSNHAHNCPKELFPAFAELSREVRAMGIDEMKRLWYPCDPADGINSLKELANLRDITIRSNRPDSYFCDPAGWLRQRLADYEQLYRLAEEYIQNHPEEKDKVNHLLKENNFCEVFYPNRPVDRKLLAEHLEETRAFCAFIEKSSLDSVKVPCMILDAMRDAVPDPSKEAVQRACRRLIERVAASPQSDLLQPLNSPRDQRLVNASEIWNLRTFSRELAREENIFDRTLQEYQKEHNLRSEFGDLESLVMDMLRGRGKEAWPELQGKIGSLRKYNLVRLKNNNYGNACGSLIQYLFRNDEQKSGFLMKAGAVSPDDLLMFRELNAEFEIQTVYYGDLTGVGGSRMTGAAEADGEVLIFFQNGSFVIRRRDGIFTPAVIAPAGLGWERSQSDYTIWKRPLALSEKWVVFGDSSRSLHIFDRRNNSWLKVPEFSPVPLRSLLIHGDRIYALAGDMEWAVHNRSNYLFRIRPDGTGREILFSSERSEKQTPLDHLRGGPSGLCAGSANELFFLLTYTNKYTMVWRYRTEENSFDKLFQAPSSGTDQDWLNRQNDGNIYLISCSWSERFYRISPESGSGEAIFLQSGSRRKSDPPEFNPVLFRGASQLSGPWLLDGDFLWCGGGTTAFLNLKKIEETPPMLLLPLSPYLFELPRGKKLFLSPYRCFVVTWKEGAI